MADSLTLVVAVAQFGERRDRREQRFTGKRYHDVKITGLSPALSTRCAADVLCWF